MRTQQAKGNYIAVAGNAADLAGKAFGWALTGLYDYDEYCAACEARGIEPRDLQSDDKHLKRAVTDVTGGRSYMKVPIKGECGGWSIKRKKDKIDDKTLDDADLLTELRVWLMKDETLKFEPEEHPLRDSIEAGFKRHRFSINTDDRSEWLLKILTSLNAINIMRKRGGVVFLPADKLAVFQPYIDVLEECGADEVDEMNVATTDPKGVRSILRGVLREAALLRDNVSKELSKKGDEKLGKRGLNSLKDRTVEFEEKLVDYEDILGDALDEIAKNMENVQASVARSILAAEAEDKKVA